MGMSLIEVQKTFGSEENCLAYLEVARWGDAVTCLKCGGTKVSKIVTNETTRERFSKKQGKTVEVRVPARRLYQCNDPECRYQFSATTGTLFNDTHLPLATWFQAIALIINAKKGISAKQMERDLGVNYRTAWFLNHRIREAMQSKEGIFGGIVEVDATFHGGRFDPRRKRAAYDKQAVAGVLQRTGEAGPSRVKAYPVPIETKPVMTGVIRDNVALDALIYTDEHASYRSLNADGRNHEIVRHSTKEYVRGQVHTNGIENFWSLFKRGVIGSFHQVSVKYLHRYLNEFSFRFNGRHEEDLFAVVVLNLVIGTALQYKALIAESKTSAAS